MTRPVFILSCVIIALLWAGCGSKLTQKDRQFLVGQGVLSLRQAGLYDLSPALEKFATPEAIRKFQAFDKKIWNFTNPKVGWSYFLNTSIITFGNMEGKNPVVAFYHPWSDVFLLTSWQVDGDGPKIADAEMLMGDFVRNKGEPPFVPAPAWLRMKTFKPAAVGDATAGAVRDIEAVFSKGSGNWRKAIPALEDRELVTEVNYAGVSLLLLTNLTEIDEIREPLPGEDPRLAPMRAASVKALELARSGKIRDVVKSADETLPAVREALARIPPGNFASLRAISFLLGRESSMVFLVPTEGSGYFVSFLFRGKPNKLKLTRIDLVDYARMYALNRASENGS